MSNDVKLIKGWLYCVYNECFEKFGTFAVKLGRTNNLKRRMQNQYTTGYATPSIYLCVSDRAFRDSRKAEALLFYIFRRYRLKDNREFFNPPPKLVREIFDRLSVFSDEMIDELFELVVKKVAPEDVLDKIRGDEVFEWFNSEVERKNWLEEFFEKFRFKPSHPEKWPGYTLPEHEDINRLLLTKKDYKKENRE